MRNRVSYDILPHFSSHSYIHRNSGRWLVPRHVVAPQKKSQGSVLALFSHRSRALTFRKSSTSSKLSTSNCPTCMRASLLNNSSIISSFKSTRELAFAAYVADTASPGGIIELVRDCGGDKMFLLLPPP